VDNRSQAFADALKVAIDANPALRVGQIIENAWARYTGDHFSCCIFAVTDDLLLAALTTFVARATPPAEEQQS
jgi:hypothetical protein